MTKSMYLKKRGFGGIEVILVILILLVGFFLAIPIVNTFFKSHHTSNIIHHEQELENWNAGIEKNQSNIPVQILGNK